MDKMDKIPPLDQNRVHYSDKYSDEKFEYRHVILPKEFGRHVPRTHLLTETEWRNLGIQQSPGWEHYMIHAPEPYILMFRRPILAGEIAIVQSRNTVRCLDELTDVIMDSWHNISQE